MTFSSYYTLAALASAAAPGLAVAGAKDGVQLGATDSALGIRSAVIQDATGQLYDVVAAQGDKARARLSRRVKAARALAQAKEPAGLSFGMERVLTYVPGEGGDSPTGDTALLIMQHREGYAKPLDTLSLDECSSVGTAIGAIHRLRGTFLSEGNYPSYTTGQIHDQLVAWIARLKQAGHVPAEITSSWTRIVATEGLWNFTTCPVHGGFDDGDLLFTGSGLSAIYHWQGMQINDPARDLAWIFGKLDDTHRNAVLSAYGRMMGSRLDDLIMLRANLWLQMEQVGDFISAIDHGDNNRIVKFKAQVERLAHQLAIIAAQNEERNAAGPARADDRSPSTITVGTLLGNDRKPMDPDAKLGNGIGSPDTADRAGSANPTTAPDAARTEIRPNTPRVPTMPDVPVANVVNDLETIVIPVQPPSDDDVDSDQATISKAPPRA